MNFDERRKVVTSVLLFVTALFVTGVATFAQSFPDRANAEPAAPAPVVLGPRYTPTPADLARAPRPEDPDAPMVALTFDDGPTAERTPYVLDVLRAKGVPATFFLQGDHSEALPDLTRRVRDEGHVVANHSYDHAYFPDLGEAAALEQIERTNRILTDITGARPTLFRYPFGEASPSGQAAIARTGLAGGMLWHWASNLPGDFQCPGADALVRYVTTEAADQALILLHDGGDVLGCAPGQWDYLPRAIDELRARGYSFGVVAPAPSRSTLNQGSRVAVVGR